MPSTVAYLTSMCAPKAPASRMRSTRFDAEPLHEQPDAGEQRCLGQLDRAHVILVDAERLGAFVQHVGPGAPSGHDTRAARGHRAVDDAVLRDDTGEVQFGEHLDDARAADTGDAGGRGSGSETGIVRPQVRADDLEARLQRFTVDAHAFDGARCRTLAATDLRTFKGGARGAGARHETLAVAEHDFGIRADVHEQRHLLVQVRPLGENHASGVGTHVTGDAGQGVHARVRVQGDAEFGGCHRHGAIDRQREGRAAEFDRVDAEHEVMHDRIADQRHFEDRFELDAGRRRHFDRQFAQGLSHGRRHLRRAARVHHRIRHPAHEVFAEADLRVHATRGRDHFAADEIAKVRGDRRRTDVDGEAIRFFMESGPDRNDARRVVHGDRDLPLSGAQGRLQLLQDRQIAFEILELPLARERQLESLQVTRGIVHVGLGHLDVVQLHQRVQLDVAGLGFLAHDLAMHLAAFRHVDDDVCLDLGLAG